MKTKTPQASPKSHPKTRSTSFLASALRSLTLLLLSLIPHQTLTNSDIETPFYERHHYSVYEEFNIMVINHRSFEHYINKIDHMFVLFFNLGCPQTAKFKLQFHELAKRMKQEIHPIGVARVDTADKTLEFAEKYNYTHTPAFRYFHKGKWFKYIGELDVGKKLKVILGRFDGTVYFQSEVAG